jgi:hypothetical protein
MRDRNKFDPQGIVQRYAGNTVIFHFDQQGENSILFREMLKIYRILPKYSFFRKVVMLPTSSYHMTIFNCTNDERQPGTWPVDLPQSATMDECTEHLKQKLSNLPLKFSMPFKFSLDLEVEEYVDDMGWGLRLKPANEEEAAKVKSLRDQLASQLGIRYSNHDNFQLHASVCYFLEDFTAAERVEFLKFSDEVHRTISEVCQVIELGPPEFCSFVDMYHFDRLLWLKPEDSER